MTKKLINIGVGYAVYKIDNADGMTDEEKIKACDRCAFGGAVFGNIVKVYTD